MDLLPRSFRMLVAGKSYPTCTYNKGSEVETDQQSHVLENCLFLLRISPRKRSTQRSAENRPRFRVCVMCLNH
jgi:hypothetical protein